MEVNARQSNNKISTEEEEALLLRRLITLRKQLEEDEPKLPQIVFNIKENMTTNKNNISSSKFKYHKVNNNRNNIHKFLSTKIDNRNFTNKQNNLPIKTNNTSLKIHDKSILLHSAPVKTVLSIKHPEIVNNSLNIEEYNLEINKIVRNSSVVINKSFDVSDVSQTLLNIDKYLVNVQDYLSMSKYIVNKGDVNSTLSNQINNCVKNVHVNRKFQNQLISNSLLNSNLKSAKNSLVSIKKPTTIIKRKSVKRLSVKSTELPNLVKIGNTKLIRRSLFRNKWKINNNLNSIENSAIERKPLSSLQCQTTNTLKTSYNRTKWNKVINPSPTLKSKSCNSSNTNKLKWTRPNILLVNNVNGINDRTQEPKCDKLILFGSNKIIRQSLINSVQSKTRNYLLKHLSHRFALMRKLQQKSNTRLKNITTSNELVKNTLLLNTTVKNKPIENKRNGKRSYSMYSYINPTLKSDNNFSLEKTKYSNIKIPRLLTVSNKTAKLQQNLKIINNDKNKSLNLSLTNNKTIDRLRSKKVLTKQLCLVFNRLGICSKLDQGKCDKRHYKKFITLCTKFLTGECSKENCTLSHNIIEEKIPFCKHYLNSVCVRLNCPYLHEYRDKSAHVCINFLHGYCTLGKKCPKKHLNLCPIFETKNKCPHGQKCLYPHVQSEEKNTADVETNEPRYFEITIPVREESNDYESTHIVPKRHAPLTDLPSFIPLKKL